jgi:succinate-semialdehyde dehydrogenase/glutarate-semialdehyde dehydrogenase
MMDALATTDKAFVSWAARPIEERAQRLFHAPLSSDGALQLILRQINDATSHGAKVLIGGNRAGTVGAFLEPTVLTGLTPDNPAYKQEFFDPVALILSANDEAEAVAIANDSPFGLGGRYSTDIERATR